MNHLPTRPIVRAAVAALDAFGAISAREARILLGYWARRHQLSAGDVEEIVAHYADSTITPAGER